MNIKKKFESIDQSQLNQNQKEILGKIKTATKDFTITDEKALQKVDGALDNIIAKLKSTNPQAIKGETKKEEPKAKKEVVKKEPKSETKKQKESKKEPSGKRTIFSIAKEIRKADESWEDAKARAKKIMEKEKEDTTKKMKTETDKLLAFIKRRKELEGLSGTSVKKDSKVEALPKGRRVSKKGWKNQYGESEGGKVYYENRDNRSDRLAPKFEDKIYLAEGGGTKGYVEIINPQKELFDKGYRIYGGDSWETLEDLKKSYSGRSLPKGAMIVKVKGGKVDYFAIAEKERFYEGGGYVVIAKSEKGGGFVMSKPSTKAKAEKLKSMLPKIDGETNEVITVAKASKLSGLVGKEYLKYADGGAILGTPETPLARDLGIDYTGLVGETGAMSSGEMFMNGGEVGDMVLIELNNGKVIKGKLEKINPIKIRTDENSTQVLPNALIKSIKKTNYAKGGGIDYTGLVGETGAMSSGEMFMDGGSTGLPAGAEQHYVNHYLNEGASAGVFANGGGVDDEIKVKKRNFDVIIVPKKLEIEVQITKADTVDHFGLNDAEVEWHQERWGYVIKADDNKKFNKALRVLGVTKKYANGGSLVDGYLTDPNFGDFQAGIYAEGGSLGNHGLKQGDQIIKTMSGGVQKVKTRTGDIVYVNLANGYRGAEPPLPFDKGGRTRERKYVNYSQKHEVRYSKDKPHRRGYGYAEGGQTIDAFQMRMVKGVDNKPDEVLTTEQEVQFAKGGAIKNEDIKVGEEFWLINGDVIEIVRLFTENTDEEWVEYKRNGEKKENSVKELRLFINRLKGKKQKSFRERRNEYLERLGQKEADVWDNIGAESGSEIRNDEKILRAYAEGVEEMLQKEEVGKGSFDQEDYDFYTDENWHLFNEFLVWNGYYEPEMTKIEKAWREDRFKDPKYRNYVSNPKIISLSNDSKSKSTNYIPKGKIATITIVKDGKEMVFLPSQVLNGVNLYKGGGKIKNDYVYMAKRYVKEVHYDDGKDLKVVKPSNGYWIKKSALKSFKQKFEGGGKTTFKEKATAIAKNFEGKKVEPKYQKEYGKVYDKAEAKEVGNKIAGSQKAKYDSKMSGGKVGKIKVGDFLKKKGSNLKLKVIEVGKDWRSGHDTITIYNDVTNDTKTLVDWSDYEKTNFATGGSTKRKPKSASNNTMVLAKQIRKDGESWQSAMKRAKEQIAKK
jgi:hypothetical protein